MAEWQVSAVYTSCHGCDGSVRIEMFDDGVYIDGLDLLPVPHDASCELVA